MAAGAPVLVRLWSTGQLDWHDGSDARDAWAQRRGAVVSPGAKVPRGEVAWTAGVWTDGDAVVVLLDGHC
ncbi:hypothetical protein ACFFKU_18145 [Kineococcus gynurae]|uniref:Uncharacterized protein n=1 Tax=Kineococcus gynurae TaxID=452979 RepID=A0ABV5LNE0_9ACTN